MIESANLIAAMHRDAAAIRKRYRMAGLGGTNPVRPDQGRMSTKTITLAQALTREWQSAVDLAHRLDFDVGSSAKTLAAQKPPAAVRKMEKNRAYFRAGPGLSEFLEKWA